MLVIPLVLPSGLSKTQTSPFPPLFGTIHTCLDYTVALLLLSLPHPSEGLTQSSPILGPVRPQLSPLWPHFLPLVPSSAPEALVLLVLSYTKQVPTSGSLHLLLLFSWIQDKVSLTETGHVCQETSPHCIFAKARIATDAYLCSSCMKHWNTVPRL